jgi:hypothetical protein
MVLPFLFISFVNLKAAASCRITQGVIKLLGFANKKTQKTE